MRCVRLQPGADLEGFRVALRRLIAEDVPPRDIAWDSAPALFESEPSGPAPPIALPRAVTDLEIGRASCRERV